MTQPLTVTYDAEADILLIDGLRYSGEVFRNFAVPDPDKLYRLVRKGDTVIIVPIPAKPNEVRGAAWDTAFDEAYHGD